MTLQNLYVALDIKLYIVKKFHTSYYFVSDVTLNDFANAAVCKNRSKKSVNSAMSVIKQIEKKEDDNRSWEEKIEDFNGDFDFVEEENEDGTKSMVMKKKERRKKKISNTDMLAIYEENGVDYPIDIWFLISEHIRPEDVGRFAGICKTSFAVVCSAKFWFTLYKRFYKNVRDLPERLQPECMVRLYGLRSCVIRSLYIMYLPLVMNTINISEEYPHDLVKRQCVLVWYEKLKSKTWLYWFKLKEERGNIMCHRKSESHKPDLLEMLEDVWANTEEHCRILMVSCPRFISVPPVMGLKLSFISLTLSQGFSYYRMQMRFGSALNCGSRTMDGASSTEIVIDPVFTYRVLDWWHPMYPHSHTALSYLVSNQDHDQ